MSWFTHFIWDPLRHLAQEALHVVEGDLAKVATLALTKLPASPISPVVETTFETGIQAAMDTAIAGLLGGVPVVGAALAPIAIEEANKALDYLAAKGASGINDLVQHARDQLAAGATTLAAAAASGQPVTMQPIPDPVVPSTIPATATH